MGIEARRAIDRLRLEGAVDDSGVVSAHEGLTTIESALNQIEVTREILQRAAGPMPTVVKTLDAIHLASALAIRERRDAALQFATYDRQQQRAAIASGLVVLSG
jgi:predicted nucleic acid-binding protein